MNPTDRTLERRSYLITTGAVATGMVGLAGCTGGTGTNDEDGDETGLLSTRVTDQPGDITDFESCIVIIEGIWVKPNQSEDDDSQEDDTEENTTQTDDGVQEQDQENIDEGDGREYYEFDEPQEADLVDLQGGETQLIDDDRELSVGSYQFLQLDVSSVEGVLADSDEQPTVETPGNAPLQFKLAFEIREGERTTFTGDFTPVKRGQTNSYLLQPVADNLSVTYDEIDSAES